jgi:polo-like kinase 4
MICGKTPFYNISRKETMNKIVNVNYEYPPEITSKSKSFIDRILKKNPNDRIDIDQVLKDRFLSQ